MKECWVVTMRNDHMSHYEVEAVFPSKDLAEMGLSYIIYNLLLECGFKSIIHPSHGWFNQFEKRLINKNYSNIIEEYEKFLYWLQPKNEKNYGDGLYKMTIHYKLESQTFLENVEDIESKVGEKL